MQPSQPQQPYQLDDTIVDLLEQTTQDMLRERLAPMMGQQGTEANKNRIEVETKFLLHQLFWSVIIWPRFSDETSAVIGSA